MRDLTVLNKFSLGSDHRMVRTLDELNLKREKMNLKTTKYGTLFQKYIDIQSLPIGNKPDLI